ncbi:MAG: ABC transporter, permease protein (cluster 2, ribose/xylose/arabinose/galactose) [uncultured Quadrisphaera sp.]|uniref:ABC transporter, permease protein (Cluster 2, ribose/xylose/arabinose/galactose) n=1 Tax=uncultured Quadrisphaera sp. TaxID=904978 RepID=A0A6J4QGE7_9ACTN|nr:MAG: ABC transporter, permease protein (cluster 2, ribose/xylose/arabinose/galactose) [uncultured Quadrisphaera sp.]
MSHDLDAPPAAASPTTPPAAPPPGTTTATGARRSAAPASARVRDLAGRYGLVVVWLVMAAVYAVLIPDTFLSLGTAQTIFGSQATLVFLGTAAVAVFVVGEFDLSIASIMGLSATTVGVLAVNTGLPEPVAVLVAFAAGVACGALNGFIIVVLGIDPIVTTLGMSVLLLGVAQAISGLVTTSGLSDQLALVASYNVGGFGLPISFYYGVVVAVAFAVVLAYTPLGRHMNFVGANREVARLSGVRVQRIRFGAYVFSGTSSSIGGILLAASVGGFDSSTSGSYLLPALAATFLGTAVVQPGKFNPLGTLITVYFLITGIVGLQLLGFSGWVSNVFYGAALVIAVTVSTVARQRLVRR